MSRVPNPKPANTSAWGYALVPLIIFAAIVALFVFALGSGDPSNLPSALLNKPPPQTKFAPLENVKRDGRALPGFDVSEVLAENKNSLNGKAQKTIVINFWASWCGPCILEHPQIVALAQRPDVDVYGVNYKDQPNDARQYLRRYGNPYKALGTDPNGRGAIEWGVTKMPETFVISPAGKVVFKFSGPITKDVLATAIRPAIERASGKKGP